jgi:hypothetical protein
MENKSVIFKPYGEKSTIVIKGTLTGKVYQVGEHSHYKTHKVIEVLNEDGRINDAFEDEIFFEDDELESDKIYTEEVMFKLMNEYTNDVLMGGCNLKAKEWFNKFKK